MRHVFETSALIICCVYRAGSASRSVFSETQVPLNRNNTPDMPGVIFSDNSRANMPKVEDIMQVSTPWCACRYPFHGFVAWLTVAFGSGGDESFLTLRARR